MKKAFTLAEVLITLSIIGLISVLTIPSLVKNYKNKLYGASIEKTYSQITDAVQAIMNDELAQDFYKTTAGVLPDDDDENNPKDCAIATMGYCSFMRNYLNVGKGMAGCTSNANNQNNGTDKPVCVADSYTTPSGAGSLRHFGECVQTANGAAICMTLNKQNGVTSVFVDTNGPAQPNFTGVDAFVMNILHSGEITDWSNDPAKCNTQSSNYGLVADYATGCLTKVMNAGWKIED